MLKKRVLRFVKFVLDLIFFNKHSAQNVTIHQGVARSFVTVTRLETQRQQSALLDSLLIFKIHLFAGALRCKKELLSSSEAEYAAISEDTKEIKFLCFLLRDIGIEMILSIVVKTDNIGALFMSQNSLTHVIIL
jgi:hypothetical protein